MANNEKDSLLKFQVFQSVVDEGFWHRLCSLKVNKLGIDESPIPLTGFFAPCSNRHVANHLKLLAESLPAESSEPSSAPDSDHGNRNKCSVPGILYNKNTLEGFEELELDKQNLLKAEVKKMWEDIHSGKVEEDSAVLLRFFVISFADLKKWNFHYCFAFPTLVLDPPATLLDLKPASQWFSSEEEVKALADACDKWRNTSSTADVPFFLVSIGSDAHISIRHLRDWEAVQRDSHKVLFGFYDPCNLPNNPGWPLRNYLAFISSRWGLEKIHFFCYRERRGFADMDMSLVGEACVSVSQAWRSPQHMPRAVGWEKSTKCISLAETMDPIRMSISASDLNLRLMRWRALPSLNLDLLSTTKCLLLGAGTLGCQVARMLLAWGIRKITLVDNGKVAMSNPIRQSLYTIDNCLDGGQFKATAAAYSLKLIHPAVEAEGVVMTIPMPGHPIVEGEESNAVDDLWRLRRLIDSHDAIFLLTDTRESRWVPSVLCANANKITINAALGFDSFLVMRHGVGPLPIETSDDETVDYLSDKMQNVYHTDRDEAPRLGCYFCNDVVAPQDSTANRTLDQQCTVTRPGLAPIASALAVELLIGLLHHPDGIHAKAGFSNATDNGSSEQPLGILPHQIRGSLSQFSQMTLVGHASTCCTACSTPIISEFRERSVYFLLNCLNSHSYLEELAGLTELKRAARSFDVDWVSEPEDDNDDDDDGYAEI